MKERSLASILRLEGCLPSRPVTSGVTTRSLMVSFHTAVVDPASERFDKVKLSADLEAQLVKYSEGISDLERTREKMGLIRSSCCGYGRRKK